MYSSVLSILQFFSRHFTTFKNLVFEETVRATQPMGDLQRACDLLIEWSVLGIAFGKLVSLFEERT